MERYEAYKDSGVEWIGKIPEGWDCCEIAYLSTCSNGATPSRDVPSYWNGDIPWMASGEIHQGYVTYTAEKITQEGLDNSSTRILPINTVMIALNGQGKTKGTAAILGIEACSNQSLAGFVCNEATLHYRWLYYCFGSMYGYLRGESGQAQRDGIATSSLKHEKIPLPSLVWQKAIADYLDAKTAEVDALVADCEREVGLLREYRKAVISEAVTKGLDPDVPMKDSGVEWIGEIPETWSMAKVKSCCDILPGYAFKSELFIQESDSVKLLRGINLGVNAIRWDEVVSYPLDEIEELGTYRLLAGDVVIGLDRPWIKEGLRIAIIQDEEFEQYLVQRVARLRGSSELDVCFVKFALESGLLEYELDSLTTGVSVPHISTEQIGSTRIALPDIVNQHEIVALLDIKTAEIDSLIEAKQSMADKLREYRRSLISEAVTGKFKVPGV